MITLHCSCGSTIRTGLGPASVTCKCGKVHGLPSVGAAAPVKKDSAPPVTPSDPGHAAPENPFGQRHRIAIHDGLVVPRAGNALATAFQNPAVAGAVSVGVLLIALVTTLALRSRAERLRAEAASPAQGTPCSFLNAGIEFMAPSGWKLVRNEGMTFAFDTGRGEVAVSVLQVTAETHAERAKSFQPTADWAAGASELPGADLLCATWRTDSKREADSWWLDRPNHRLWISASGKPGVRSDAASLIKTLKLTEPAPASGH
ncbi:MAG: hypothetical protein K8T20_14080 [Planctomycetes bacterium]|nr:hypothetical protein [Planctomycetota bacterium]